MYVILHVILGAVGIVQRALALELPFRQVDLLTGIPFPLISSSGVEYIPGPQGFFPALLLTGDSERELRVSPEVQSEVETMIRSSSDFTFLVSLEQDEYNAGAIFSFSLANDRFLELQTSRRKDEIRLHYTYAGMASIETFKYKWEAGQWHKLAISVSGFQVEVFVNCERIGKTRLPGLDTSFLIRQQPTSLWIGQRNSHHLLYKGKLQELRIISGPGGFRWQCPNLDPPCPTCGQYQQLTQMVQHLSDTVTQLSQKLAEAESRLSRLEECDCRKPCHVNGSVHPDGASWQQDCNICSCVQGSVTCRQVQCPAVTCKNPVYTPGECCPVCLKHCYLAGEVHEHGETVTMRQCLECTCNDGSMECRRLDPKLTCPPLSCPVQQQILVEGQCCKVCPGVDYCGEGHSCHANATCLNLRTTYACQCNRGFTGDGRLCTDMDECESVGGLEGHHCHAHTRCVNTPGSYECQCLPGYVKVDAWTCKEHDECQTGQHHCHPHATCRNTDGGYECLCNQGYVGDGFHCQPVCEEECVNGGMCVGPDRCACRGGFTGPRCESDVDECELGIHVCDAHPNALCVNQPGWYYCKCEPGFSSILSPRGNNLTTAAAAVLCLDINECESGEHTCHETAKCVNTEGSFQCVCPDLDLRNCTLSCMYEGQEYLNGEKWLDESGCAMCNCQDGVMQCERVACGDCEGLGEEEQKKCCPKCSSPSSSVCRHPEEPWKVIPHGQNIIHQCQTCECLFGELDCWPLPCPPLLCDNPTYSAGDCCPRCPDDPCQVTPGHYNETGKPCNYMGHLMKHGAKWSPLHHHCTTCQCRDGKLCCTFNADCSILDSSMDPISVEETKETESYDAQARKKLRQLFLQTHNQQIAHREP